MCGFRGERLLLEGGTTTRFFNIIFSIFKKNYQQQIGGQYGHIFK